MTLDLFVYVIVWVVSFAGGIASDAGRGGGWVVPVSAFFVGYSTGADY